MLNEATKGRGFHFVTFIAAGFLTSCSSPQSTAGFGVGNFVIQKSDLQLTIPKHPGEALEGTFTARLLLSGPPAYGGVDRYPTFRFEQTVVVKNYEATVVLRNAGGCPAEIEVEFRDAGEEPERRKVFVPYYHVFGTEKFEDDQATVVVSLPWKPVTAVLDPDMWIMEAVTKRRVLKLSDR